MCITQQCANPTLAGVWWREDDRWCLYGAGHQQQIRNALSAGLRSVDLGTISSTVHPSGARYTVNLSTMQQTALSSGFTRSVLVIDPVAPPAPIVQPQRPLSLPSPVSSQNRQPPINLHYRDSRGNLVQYATSVAGALWNAVCQGLTSCFVRMDSSSLYDFFDLKGMVQLVAVLSDGRYVFLKEKPVSVVVEVAWIPKEMAALAVRAEKGWRRKVLEMVVKRCGSDNHLEDILREKARPKVIVRSQRISLAPGESTHERFLDSLDRTFTRSDPKLLGGFLEKLKDGCSGLDDGLLQIAVKPEPSVSTRSGTICSFREKKDTVVLLSSMMSALAAEMRWGMTVAVFLIVMSNPISKVDRDTSLGQYNRVGHHEPFEVNPENCLRLAEITVK